MKDKLFGIVPVIVAALLGLVLSNLTMSDTDNAVASPQTAFDEVKARKLAEAELQVAEAAPAYVPPSEGAGYKPEVETTGECNCVDCLDEEDVRKIVRDEFNNQVMAEKVAPRASIPNAVSYSSPAVTYSSPAVTYRSPTVTYSAPAVTYSQPAATTTVRRGLFGRTIYRTTTPASGTCRIVNGVRVCN